MNRSIRGRLERLEHEQRFQDWCESVRVIESFTKEQLEEFYQKGYLSGPYPDPPHGESRLDHLDRRTLIRMWQENEREYAGRSAERFYSMVESRSRWNYGGTSIP